MFTTEKPKIAIADKFNKLYLCFTAMPNSK